MSVDYRMEKTDTGWKVYDVKIEGISLVENYRNTFNSEVQRSGIDGLIKSLADKNKSTSRLDDARRNDLVLGRPLRRAGAGDHGERRVAARGRRAQHRPGRARSPIDLAAVTRGRFDRREPSPGVAPPRLRPAAPSATSICLANLPQPRRAYWSYRAARCSNW